MNASPALIAMCIIVCAFTVTSTASAEVVTETAPEQVYVQSQLQQSVVVQTASPEDQLRMEQRRRRSGLGLIISGWTVFGLGIFSSLATYVSVYDDQEGGAIIFLPVVGPIIMAARAEGNGGWFDDVIVAAMRAGLILNCLTQIAGLVLATTGHVRRRRAIRGLYGTGHHRAVALVPTGTGIAGRF